MKSFFLATVLGFMSVSCAATEVQPADTLPTEPVQAGEVLVECEYKYDKAYNVTFLKRNKVEYRPAHMPTLLLFHIVDTKGKNWAVNEYDWDNYVCTETNIPKG